MPVFSSVALPDTIDIIANSLTIFFNSILPLLVTIVNAAISCAGIAISQKTLRANRDIPGEWTPHSLDAFTQSLMVNTVGSFNVARLSAQRMAIRDAGSDSMRGCIINTASIAAMDGQKGQVAYASSKGALVSMTLPMARDLASIGVRVMTIVRAIFYLLLACSRDMFLNCWCTCCHTRLFATFLS